MELIDRSDNYYVIQVKRNQKTLFSAIEKAICTQFPLDSWEEHEKGHGRQSSWYVSVYNAINNDMCGKWRGLKRFVHVHKRVVHKGKISHSDRLYASSSFSSDARFFHQGIRNHWRIENALHYVKDVFHKEDKNRIRKGSGPLASAVFSSVAINLHRKNGQYSIKDGQMVNSSNVNQLFELLNQKKSCSLGILRT